MRVIPKLVMLFVFTLVFVLPLSAQKIIDQIDQVMDEFVNLDIFSGTVLVARDGEILYAKALEIDPNFDNAKKMLQKLDELEKK